MRGIDGHYFVLYARKRLTEKSCVVHVIEETRNNGFIVQLTIVPRRFLPRLCAKSIIEHGRQIVFCVTGRYIVVVYVALIIEKLWRQKNFQRYQSVDCVIKKHI